MGDSGGGASRGALIGAFGGCVLIWGSTFLVIAIGNDTVPPVWGATLRLALAGLILFAIMAVRRLPFPRGAGLRTAAVYGFFQFGLNFPLLYVAETDAPSGLAAVIFATIPLSTIFLARLFRLEGLSLRRIIGGVIALGGIGVMFSTQLRGALHPKPLIEMILATWCACLGSIAVKRGPRQSPIVTNAVACWVGFVVCWVWSVALGEPRDLPRTGSAIVPIVYLAVAGSVGAFVLFTWLVHHWDVSRSSYIAVITPPVAVSLGALVRHERLGPATLFGALIVLVGVAVGLRAAAPPPPPRQPVPTSSSSRGSTG